MTNSACSEPWTFPKYRNNIVSWCKQIIHIFIYLFKIWNYTILFFLFESIMFLLEPFHCGHLLYLTNLRWSGPLKGLQFYMALLSKLMLWLIDNLSHLWIKGGIFISLRLYWRPFPCSFVWLEGAELWRKWVFLRAWYQGRICGVSSTSTKIGQNIWIPKERLLGWLISFRCFWWQV